VSKATRSYRIKE